MLSVLGHDHVLRAFKLRVAHYSALLTLFLDRNGQPPSSAGRDAGNSVKSFSYWISVALTTSRLRRAVFSYLAVRFCCVYFPSTSGNKARMISGSSSFTLLLQTLGLMQGIGKPTPGIPSPLVSSSEKDPSLLQSHPLRPPPNLRIEYRSSDCSVEPYQSADCTKPVFAPFDSVQSTVYRYRQQQSVNLGSWYVLLCRQHLVTDTLN